MATADAALDEAGVFLGGVAITAGDFSSLQMAILSSASALRCESNHAGMACLHNGGAFGILDVWKVV